MTKVELEFKRIQTYLFSSPRLRAMLGANSKLGSTVRVELTELALQCGAKSNATLSQNLPSGSEDDPLTNKDLKPHLRDDPQNIYKKYGVLVRDGGHFIATFDNAENASNFVQAATKIITKNLPGILIEARLNGDKVNLDSSGESLFQHPAFQVSHQLGNQPASQKNYSKGTFVSEDEALIEEAGKEFRKNPSDLIAILENHGVIPTSKEVPESLNDLTTSGYLALIHADGNSIGARYKRWKQKTELNGLKGLDVEAHGEFFFHSMRVAVRKALTQALNEVFMDSPRSYQLLMLGGDDLLLACDMPFALPFAQAYANALTSINLADGKPLTVGVGVAIAKSTFPFYRLHAIAEELATSAKQLSRSDETVGSVIDWHISSNSWVNSPISERKEANLLGNVVLSNKPYPILGNNSLETLLTSAAILKNSNNFARSQLRHLVETLRLGASQAELAWLELPIKLRNDLSSLLEQFGYRVNDIFQTNEALGISVSLLPDIVELVEIQQKAQTTHLSKNHAEGKSA